MAVGLFDPEQQIVLDAGFDDSYAQHVVGTKDLVERKAKKAALCAFVRDGASAVDAVRDRLFSVFRNSGPIRAMLFSTLERISFTDDPEIRLDLLRQYFNRLRPIPGKAVAETTAVGGIFGLLRPRATRSPAGRGGGAGQPQTKPLERTPGGNEEERLATIRRKVAAPGEFFDQRAGAAFDSIPWPPANADKNVKRGLAAIDLALEDRLAGGQGIVGHAMHHPGVVPIAFRWGSPGTFAENFQDGHGLSHVIVKHGPEVLRGIVDTIAYGKIRTPKRIRATAGKLVIERSGFKVILTRDNPDEVWLLSGYKTAVEADRPFDLSQIRGPLFFKSGD